MRACVLVVVDLVRAALIGNSRFMYRHITKRAHNQIALSTSHYKRVRCACTHASSFARATCLVYCVSVYVRCACMRCDFSASPQSHQSREFAHKCRLRNSLFKGKMCMFAYGRKVRVCVCRMYTTLAYKILRTAAVHGFICDICGACAVHSNVIAAVAAVASLAPAAHARTAR